MSKARVISPFHGHHNHADCQSEALRAAKAECNKRGLKLTKVRQQVLEIIWSSHNPIGAYDVLQKLQAAGHKPAPPTAYRALDFLVSANLIHRLESLNAYIGCPSPQSHHECLFFICQSCGHTAELHSDEVNAAIEKGADALGFTHHEPIIEVHGVCQSCASKN